jgi:hypothetical protein
LFTGEQLERSHGAQQEFTRVTIDSFVIRRRCFTVIYHAVRGGGGDGGSLIYRARMYHILPTVILSNCSKPRQNLCQYSQQPVSELNWVRREYKSTALCTGLYQGLPTLCKSGATLSGNEEMRKRAT